VFWRLPFRDAVALTFDDGPDPEVTPRVLDALAAAGARATFFVLGERAARHPQLVRRAMREGHTVGNHTYSHPRCPGLGGDALARELESTDALLRGTAGTPIFRPPHGKLTPRQVWALTRMGRRIALWSCDSRDYLGADTAAIARVGETAVPGDVVLLHDRFARTADALPELLAGLARRGLATVALDEVKVGN
jgi:peptidoglycan/xylan/chitin deacetylase (PgdA/CDA1 family)